MTATLLQDCSSARSSTCSGLLVSTTTSRVFPSAMSIASCGLMKALTYSGVFLSFSMSDFAAVFSVSATMCAGTPYFLAMLQTATEPPTLSMSPKR